MCGYINRMDHHEAVVLHLAHALAFVLLYRSWYVKVNTQEHVHAHPYTFQIILPTWLFSDFLLFSQRKPDGPGLGTFDELTAPTLNAERRPQLSDRAQQPQIFSSGPQPVRTHVEQFTSPYGPFVTSYPGSYVSFS